ncbi:fkbM_fam, methyltransferase, FkbM family [uncultured Caudovirales phage]|uniref:FkbM_fam, methyltransferase, FkbM family n=1 Tax=uncultured Caudovirales phage TaxID=2100421 RepID=A0A6J7WXM2_9CAUD|nr:fkbM_fam, methyltransferase, FkbM family [uncultured Caudovirales phage]
MTYFNRTMIERAKRGVMLDIGACHGIYMEPMSEKATKVYAFEPFHENLNVMYKANKFPNVEIVPVVLSDKDDRVRLYTCTKNGEYSIGQHTISNNVADIKDWGHSSDKFNVVRSYRLDTFVKEQNISNITAIKIDVEGAEDRVLEGARQTLKDNNAIISIETHVPWDFGSRAQPFVDMLKSVETILRDCGYVFWTPQREMLTYMDKSMEFYCVKPNADGYCESPF